MKVKTLQWFQFVVLVAGNIVAWSTVVLSYRAFFQAGYGILNFRGCTVANPLATPCFYGAVAFLIALAWAGMRISEPTAKSFRHLSWLLVASAIFGWVNVIFEIYKINANAGKIVACGARTVTSIYQSSCLYGTIAFTLALILSFLIYKKLKSESVVI